MAGDFIAQPHQRCFEDPVPSEIGFPPLFRKILREFTLIGFFLDDLKVASGCHKIWVWVQDGRNSKRSAWPQVPWVGCAGFGICASFKINHSCPKTRISREWRVGSTADVRFFVDLRFFHHILPELILIWVFCLGWMLPLSIQGHLIFAYAGCELEF